MIDDTQRLLGQLEARADNSEDRLSRIEDKLDHIVSAIDGAKGGWRMLLAVGAIASGFTAGILKFIEFVGHK